MILASENATKEFQQSEAAPQFTVEAPRLNPLVASATFSLTKGIGGIALDSVEDAQEQPVRDNETLSSRIITRSKREVERRPKSARARCPRDSVHECRAVDGSKIRVRSCVGD